MVPVYPLVQPRPWTSFSSPKMHPMDGRLQGAKNVLVRVASELVPTFAPLATSRVLPQPRAQLLHWKDGGSSRVVIAWVLGGGSSVE